MTFLGLSGLGGHSPPAAATVPQHVPRHRARKGLNAADILAARHSVAEGAYTATAVQILAQRLGIETPISTAVHHVLAGTLSITEAIGRLLDRPVKAEVG